MYIFFVIAFVPNISLTMHARRSFESHVHYFFNIFLAYISDLCRHSFTKLVYLVLLYIEK